MYQQESEEPNLIFTLQYQSIKQRVSNLPSLPIQHKKLLTHLSKLDNITPQLQQEIISINKLAIEERFVKMMETIFTEIEPYLAEYRKHQNINYLDHVIVSKLDREIYHKGYKLHKKKDTPMAELLINREVDIANRLFTELFDIMNQLLITMKIYYGYQEDESISEALYEAIGRFIQNNEDSMILAEDRLSMVLQEEKQKSHQKKKKQADKYEIVIDVLQAISKQQQGNSSGLIEQASKFAGVFYKYGVSPAVETVYDVIKSVNPLASTKKLTKEQQQSLKTSLISHLLPHLSVREPLEEKLVTYLIRLVPMNTQQILMTMGPKEIEQFTEVIGKVLNNYENPSNTFKEIVKQLMMLLNLALSVETQESDDFYTDFQQGKWIILLYKTLEPNYNPERRRLLLQICWFPEISQKLINPIGILKLVQSQSLPQSQLLKKMRHLSIKNPDQTQQESKGSKQKNTEIFLSLEHELHRLHLYQLKKKFKNPPLIEFEKVTNCSSKRTITLLFSGFMSQDTSKIDEWEGILDSVYDSEIYTVRWESKSYGDVFDFAVQAGKDIAKANLSIGILGQLGGPYLRAVAIIRQLYKKYHNNPFNPAFQSAQITGIFIAELLIANFQSHFINLVGFSLGAELIKNIVKRLSKRNSLGMINKLYLMGGVSDKQEWQQIIENANVPLNILNLHSDNDSTLKYFLKLCKPEINPIGLYPLRQDIAGQIIINQDCTKIIDGHLGYRKNLRVLDKLMNIKDD